MMSFGRLDSDYHTLARVINIEGQQSIPGIVHDQLSQLTTVDLPITRANYIRMWKTLILKRVQDVIERQRLVRPEHYVRLARTIQLPAPLADLLYSLGQFHSRQNGIVYQVAQPARPDPPETWWAIDHNIVQQWIQTHARFQHCYVMREFPSQTDWEHKSMIVTAINDDGEMRSVKSLTAEPTINDAFVRFVSDDIYGAEIPYADCHLRIVEGLDRGTIRYEYVRSYVTGISC